MQMTTADLATLLNERFGFAGRNAITVNVIRQWVAWDLLPKAEVQGRVQGGGPVWARSEAALRQATRLAELRKAGIRRQNALIVQAYIEWGHPDFCRVREALASEWKKWTAQLNHRQLTAIGESKYQELSASRKRAIANQTGPLDAIFAGTPFEQSPEFYGTMANRARYGEANSEIVASLMGTALARISPDVARLMPRELLSTLAESLSGLAGEPDEIENSGQSAIQIATEQQFEIAGRHVRSILNNFQTPSVQSEGVFDDPNMSQLQETLRSLAPHISIGPWIILQFVQALKAVCRR